MVTSAKYVTREEFEPVKTELHHLSIRVEVITHDLHRLTNQVADLAEDMNARFDAMDARFDVLEKSVTDGHAAIISALLKLTPR